MYRIVPRMSPVCVRSSASDALARPKSVTQTFPLVSRRRLLGLISRWQDALVVRVIEGFGHLHSEAGDAAEEMPVRLGD